MAVNKTVAARSKYRTQTPVGEWKVRFVYDLGGNTVYGVWVNLPQLIANGMITANHNPQMRVVSLEIERLPQPQREGKGNASGQ